MGGVGGRYGIRWLIAAYLAFIAAVGVVHLAVEPARPWLAGVVGLTTAGAVVLGVQLHQPARRLPWYLIAAGLVANAGARIIFTLQGMTGPFDRQPARAAPIFALHLTALVLIVTALVLLSRVPPKGHRLLSSVDGTILVLGTGLLAWVVIAAPWAIGPAVDRVQVYIRIGYVTRDVIFLVALARLVTTVRWNAAVGWISAAILSLITYDVFVRIGLVGGEAVVTPLTSAWVIFYGCLGAAALVPGMAKIVATSGRRTNTGVLPLVLVACSAVIPFVLLLSGVAGDRLDSPAPIAFVSALMLLLVLLRMTLSAVRLGRSLSQTGTIADVSAELVGAADDAAVESAVQSAAARLVGARNPVTSYLTDGLPDRPERPDRLIIPLEAPGGNGQPRGALVVRGPAIRLAAARGPLTVVAAQASQALARVRLNEQVISTRRDEYFRALVQNSTDVILIVDDNTRIRYASPSATDLFGTSSVDSRRLPELLARTDRAPAESMLLGMADRPPDHGRPTVSADWRISGQPERWVEVSCVDLRGDPAIRGIVVTLRDVTERRRLEERLTEQAFHDPLTGLGNRSLFTQGTQRAVETPRTNGFAGVLFIDLDDFKVINDGYGHVVGDAFLQNVGARIRSAAYPHGIAARIGGDEFAVLVEQAELADIDTVAERLVTALARPATIQGEVVRCGASVGVATTADSRSYEELLRHADLALYEAKGTGKQRWRRFNPSMHNAVMQRLELRTALAEALNTQALHLEFQPIVALKTGVTVGFEALLRWNHPTRGRLQPAEFIELAEDSGLIEAIGEWVLNSAINEAVQWAQTVPGSPPFVSVNVSPRQFQSPEVFEMVRRRLTQSGLAPHRLMLEITENLLLADDTAVTDGLGRLRRLGVRIAIDDFGTGYSGLGYLQRVPLDVVKLDRLFTKGMVGSSQQRDLVAGIVQLASTLGLEVIAEGVENQHEQRLIQEAGCPYGQGFVFSRPLPPADALQWAARHGRVPARAARSD